MFFIFLHCMDLTLNSPRLSPLPSPQVWSSPHPTNIFYSDLSLVGPWVPKHPPAPKKVPLPHQKTFFFRSFYSLVGPWLPPLPSGPKINFHCISFSLSVLCRLFVTLAILGHHNLVTWCFMVFSVLTVYKYT